MAQVDSDAANARIVQDQLAAAGAARPNVPPPPSRPVSARPPLIGAGAITAVWLILCAVYLLGMRDASAYLTLEQGILYGMAAVLPVMAVWLLAVGFVQMRALSHTSRLINESLLAMTYPGDDAQQRVAGLVRTLKSQAAELAKASDMARDRTEAMERTLQRQMEALAQASANVGKGSDEASATLTAQATALDGALEALRQRASGIETAIAGAAETLSRISSQSLENTRSAQSALANRTDELLGAAERASQRTEAISETYAGIIGKLDEATGTAARQIDEINLGYESQAQAMLSAGDALAAKMRDITELARKEVAAIEEAGERTRDRADRMEQTVAAHGKRLNGLAAETKAWIAQTADHFTLQAEFMKNLSA